MKTSEQAHNFNQVVVLTAEEPTNFKSIFSVEKKYLPQALEMSQVFQQAINHKTLEFDFDKALQLVQEHTEMAVVGTINQTIQQSTAQVSAMVDKLKALLKTILMATLQPQQEAQYSEAITQAFTNLAPQEGNAWIFWKSEEAHKTTYQYNILFAIQNKSTGSVMAALPIGLTIEVNIDKKQVLFITIKDQHEYNVQVKAITVVEALKG
ncbi:MAG: delta-endotoxin CytB [Okeania sp. SIO3B5]|uniref:hypothetical protein n=1 Tax=Okeania sp. SIO3B5 TaxID=2607811 RepID=UPI00140048D7|nr:hypothetical protein [Okeania sp. SIO3B5]NEO52085.1 delta-endotoxin CytB [Okeania sp. SIO3B5]